MCPRMFTNKSEIAPHERTHTGEKPYACSMCPRMFSKNCHVAPHERTHTGEKPYACSMCPRMFDRHARNMCFALCFTIDYQLDRWKGVRWTLLGVIRCRPDKNGPNRMEDLLPHTMQCGHIAAALAPQQYNPYFNRGMTALEKARGIERCW